MRHLLLSIKYSRLNTGRLHICLPIQITISILHQAETCQLAKECYKIGYCLWVMPIIGDNTSVIKHADYLYTVLCGTFNDNIR